MLFQFLHGVEGGVGIVPWHAVNGIARQMLEVIRLRFASGSGRGS